MSKKKEHAILALLVFWVVSMIAPILIATCYAIPSADDFTNATPYLTSKGNLLIYLTQHTIDTYLNWQGTFTGSFICLIPVYTIGSYSLLRIELFVVAVLFMVSLYFFLDNCNQKILKDDRKVVSMLLFATMLFYVLGTSEIDEVFFWHTGVGVYTIPLSLMFFALGVFLQNGEGSRWKFVLASLAAFLANGGALDICVLLDSFLLLGFIVDWHQKKTTKKKTWILLAAIVGGLINLVAPGNFMRHAEKTENLSLVKNFLHAFVQINRTITSQIETGMLLPVIVLGLFLGFYLSRKVSISVKQLLVIFLYGNLAMIATDFPVAVGYNGPYFPNRVIFVERIAVFIYVMIIVSAIGIKIGNRCAIDKGHIAILSLMLVIAMAHYANIDNLLEITPYKMSWHLARGDFEREKLKQEAIIAALESSQEREVVIKTSELGLSEDSSGMAIHEQDAAWTNLKTVGLANDPSFWINRDIADYYDKDSIILFE